MYVKKMAHVSAFDIELVHFMLHKGQVGGE